MCRECFTVVSFGHPRWELPSTAWTRLRSGRFVLRSWSATQSVYPTRSIVAKLVALPIDSVRVIYVRGSGCYGLNGADAVSFDAALLSHAVGRPVRVQLSHQDEMAWENFGSACVIEQHA